MNKCNKCGKIFVPIPGDDRDESFCLRCERNVLKAELERANREHEKLTEALSEDLERVQKQAAEMRDALGKAVGGLHAKALNDPEMGRILDHARFSMEAGHGYLSPAELREVVKPLVEFAERCVEDWSCDVDHDGDHPPDCRHCAALDLLSQAKAKGWVP